MSIRRLISTSPKKIKKLKQNDFKINKNIIDIENIKYEIIEGNIK